MTSGPSPPAARSDDAAVRTPDGSRRGPARRGLFGGGIDSALLRYRVMAYVVGTMLILLVFVAIPLQYAASAPAMATVVAPLHGYLYIVYLVAGADLARRARWRLGRIVMVVCAGFVPFLAFVVERRVSRQVHAELAAEPTAAADAQGPG